MHFKKRKPKKYKGHCWLCCLKDSDGRRNGRKRTRQEIKAGISAREQGLYVRKEDPKD